MLIEVFLFLVMAGVLPVAIKGKRLSFLYLLLLVISSILMLCYFYQNWQQGTKDDFTYDWVSSPYYPVRIHLFSHITHYAQIFPFFLISVIMIIFNCFSKIEKRKLEQNGLICLNLAALIMLICSENTIQLLTSACVIDILGFNKQGNKLYINPHLPDDFQEYTITYKYHNTTYNITINLTGKKTIILDGKKIKEDYIPLINDEKIHNVTVNLGGKNVKN